MTLCKVDLTSREGPARHCRGAACEHRGRAGQGAALALAAALLAPGCGAGELDGPVLRSAPNLVEYPYDLWEQGIEGTALVRVLVNEAGGVDSVTVAGSSGVPALDSAAVNGALRMEFEPARRGGEPARVWTRVPVHFTKDGAAAGDSPAGDPPPALTPGAVNDA